MENRKNSEISAEERKEIFHDTYDTDVDPGYTLADLVHAAGDYLTLIVGSETADRAMTEVAKSLHQYGSKDDWRAVLEDNRGDCYHWWPLGQDMHDLVAYARFGILLSFHAHEDAAARERRVDHMLAQADQFIRLSPLEQWLGKERSSPLEETIMLAHNRRALEKLQPIDPAALAVFGNVSLGRIRNMLAGENPVFSRIEGKVPATEALSWLSDRRDFWNSVWMEQPVFYRPREAAPQSMNPLFLPVARDGTAFNPGLLRGSHFTIGSKGNETQVESFEDALAKLQTMPTPYWRRPNEAGNWGIVTAVRWERIDRKELDVFLKNPSHRLMNN